jgi:hypothetical protein
MISIAFTIAQGWTFISVIATWSIIITIIIAVAVMISVSVTV